MFTKHEFRRLFRLAKRNATKDIQNYLRINRSVTNDHYTVNFMLFNVIKDSIVISEVKLLLTVNA